jgi:erythromycin esterase-like protein
MTKHFLLILLQVSLARAASPEIVTGLYQIPSIEFTTPDSELDTIGDLVKNAEVVALGEAIHTVGTFHKANARIAKYLIEKKGFRLLTLETPHRPSVALSKYIDCDKQINLSFALQRIFPQFASAELSELYNWVRQYNCTHPNDKVSFTGFDVQQNHLFVPDAEMDTYLARPFIEDYIRKNIPALVPQIADLQLCGPTATQFAAPKSDDELQKCVSAISFVFSSLNQISPADQFEVSAALISLFQNAQGKRFGNSDFVNSMTWRDLGMAKVISLIRKIFPGTKMVIIAHNSHVFRSSLQNFKNMGSYLDDEFGDKYFVIASLSSQIVALPFHSLKPQQPNSNSVEAVLSGFNKDNLLLNAKINSVQALKIGLEVQADQSTGVITPYVPISKLTDLVIYSRTSSVMSLVPGVQYPPDLKP